jgi:hypothetical protein
MVLAWIIGGLFGEGLTRACLVLGAGLAPAWLVFWRAGETAILSQSVTHSVQIGYAAPKAQEKPSVSFI